MWEFLTYEIAVKFEFSKLNSLFDADIVHFRERELRRKLDRLYLRGR